jgi:hypothetical protein
MTVQTHPREVAAVLREASAAGGVRVG